ncbi:hypothetical protein ACIQVE_11795 [Pseudomonas sp. NPDC098747]|uniref:hypothetical protein n=1 Tax=Pseudomonas sp. NPDC098747 TaxID=3364487 RepID=UPI00383A0B7C
MNIPFADLQLQQHREDTLNALRLPNQRVQPVRQNEEADIYAQMVKKLNDKPSVKEILLAYTHG